jgi:hypothetical protein
MVVQLCVIILLARQRVEERKMRRDNIPLGRKVRPPQRVEALEDSLL